MKKDMKFYMIRQQAAGGSAVTLRNEVINYLNTNNMSPDGFPIERFAGIPLGQYFLKNRKR